MQYINRPDAILHLQDQGPKHGRAVVFANSLGTDLRVWDAMIDALPSELRLGLRLVRYDKRGHGLSQASPAPYSMDTLVQDAEAICDSLQLSDVTFVGLSIGGLIAQGLAARRPDLLRAMVLMDTAAQIGTAAMWQTRIDAIHQDGIASLSDAIMERWFTPGFRHTRPEFALWTAMLNRTTIDGYCGCSAAIAGADFRQSTAKLQVPTLVIAGDQDGSTPPALVRATADLIKDAQFELVADAGHLPCVEQPKATAALLADFLERTAA